MSRNSSCDRRATAFVLMLPKVTDLFGALYAKRTEINCHLVGVVIAIEDTKHIVAIGHLSIPYLIVLVVELVAERLAHETILVEGEQLIVGIILHVIANRRWQVGGCDWATSHQLQGNYRLLLRIGIKVLRRMKSPSRITLLRPLMCDQ